MTRVVGGSARGRRLRVPADGTRPTSDRAREAVFSSLESLRGLSWADTVVLDLYAGSGALGLEALSRGAARVDLVEADRRAAQVVRANVALVAPVSGTAHVHLADVERWVRRPPGGVHYDVVFCDPPYSIPGEAVRPVLTALVDGGSLADGCLVVVERPQRDAWVWSAGFEPVRDRRYGEAHIWVARASRSSLVRQP